MQIYSLVKLLEMKEADFYKDFGVIEKDINMCCIEEHFWVVNGVLVKYTGKQVDVRIPEEVKAIDDWIFIDCSNMESVFIPHSVWHVGRFAFANCKALSKVIYEGTEEEWLQVVDKKRVCIEGNVQILCFDMSCEDKMYIIKAGVLKKYIGDKSFGDCIGLESIIIPPNVISIGDEAFYGCSNLTSIEISPNVINIGMGAFSLCGNLSQVEIPPRVTYIGARAFSFCKNLKQIEIPPRVTYVGDYAFSGCKNLKSIQIPSSLEVMGCKVFSYCNELKHIFFEGSKKQWEKLIAGNNLAIPEGTRIHYNYRK